VAAAGQQQLPIQPVENPILCSPYQEPEQHWVYNTTTGEAYQQPGRRPAGYWYTTKRTGSQQLSLMAEEQRDDLPLVNLLREDVRRWREAGYPNATRITRELLQHWWREDRPRRLFFCQLEAVETIIYLNEILASGKRLPWRPRLDSEDHRQLLEGHEPSFLTETTGVLAPRLIDVPNEPGGVPLVRYGCKMATGSGKTVVMAMLIAWAFCNRGQVSSDERFPRAVLVCCPNLTIKERLAVLRPENANNYYADFDLVPVRLRPLLAMGKVLVTNWHAFAPESEQFEDGKSWAVVDKGQESPEAFARRVLGDLYDLGPLLVFNDEAHHAYRPAPLPEGKEKEKPTAEEAREANRNRQEATVWVAGLDRLNAAVSIRCCVDLSATPFYLQGSGYITGSPLPWLVSDFGLVDAIESGITKIPRIPVATATGRPDPKYFRLWQSITSRLEPGERLGGKGGPPKPEVVWREAQDALYTLASQWKERLEYVEQASDQQDKLPPVMIICCDNTDIAQLFYEQISGERQIEMVGAEPAAVDGAEEEEDPGPRKRRAKKTTVYGDGAIFPELLSNSRAEQRTVRIDSRLLEEAESEEPGKSRQDAAEALRKLIATVGKRGEPGEQVRCVVSVMMLTEGWDSNNVTQILGLRAFDSQLLCEQVVGRGLRRMDYTPDPQTGLLTEEYVDVYGIPFSMIPFKGREATKKEPGDQPKNHVRALPERRHLEIRFPLVEGYAFALRRNVIRADIDRIAPVEIEVDRTPTAVFVKPSVGFQDSRLTAHGPGAYERHDRQEYYDSTHPQTIKFEIARQVVALLVGDGMTAPNPRLGLQSRHQLFPQVLRLVDAYVRRRVDLKGEHPCELGLEKYVRLIVERLVTAIEPDEAAGEVPLLPILNRYKEYGSTTDVDFKTVLACTLTQKSQINQVAAHSTWESEAAARLDGCPEVCCYARNECLNLTIPYDYEQIRQMYEPDFIVRMIDDTMVILEIKGQETERDRAKYQAARRWCAAVSNWGKMGRWLFHVTKTPHTVGGELAHRISQQRLAS
jgi:type III restriction enzyme